MGFLRNGKGKRRAHGGVRLATLPLPGGEDRGGKRRQEKDDDDDDAAEEQEAAQANVSPAKAAAVAAMAAATELAPVFLYDHAPDEVLLATSQVVDLSVWSVVTTDACVLRLGLLSGADDGEEDEGGGGGAGIWSPPPSRPSSNQLADVLLAAASAISRPHTRSRPSVRTLNLHGAQHITDQALLTIARRFPSLTQLDLSRAARVSDVGLRHLVSACRQLQCLQLSYVPTLGRGAALSAIGDCRLPLRELGLAGCAHLPDFALQRVFRACGATLESLDLSDCSDSVSDNTLLALSRAVRDCGSTRLRSLRLRGCRQVSDAGVVEIAGACVNLSLLDLSRGGSGGGTGADHHRLSDVALLALADKCALLQSLELCGCASVSDVGLSWLASGCPGITQLDLSHCVKLTDVGMRAIGDHLLRLQNLSLRDCTRVSDRGLHHLAHGCQQLTNVDLSGLALLSDAGVTAIARHCTALTHLNLSRCAAISDAALLALATHARLAVLKLSGCNRVTSHGVLELLTHQQLTTLALQHCTRVDDHAFLSMALVLSHLTNLKLRDCEGLSDTGVRALASANAPLVELDLGGCKRLSDLAVLALTEAPCTASSLRFLWLCGLPQLTATALAWLSAKCATLLLLDLTGCTQIRSFSLRALAGGWKFAVLPRNNGSFQGLQPMHRARDREWIEAYGACWQAAIRIQSAFRVRVARREAAARREIQLRHWVATRLQSVWRGRCARRAAVVERMQFQRKTLAAGCIQSAYRRRLARRQAARERLERYEARKHSSARSIQLAWRRKQLRQKLLGRELRRLSEQRRRTEAATTLQRVWRGVCARGRCKTLRVEKHARDSERHKAATKLQSIFRQRAARRDAHSKRAEHTQRHAQRERAARVLQRRVRRRHWQRELEKRLRERRAQHHAAACLQRAWRRKKTCVAAQLTTLAMRNKRDHDAAVTLQAAWKRKQGRAAVRVLRLVQSAQQQQLVTAVVKVQTTWRGRAARKQVAQTRQAALARVLAQVKMEHDSAALVQAHFRGRRGRRAYAALVFQRKQQRWKAIVDSSGAAVYYNKETGEVRFRRPQDVLDLLPKPHCDNCRTDWLKHLDTNISIAHVECQDCGEMYCNDCWGHVHAGGRRKAHAFRALYDFYGRRVDYGDGEFPSKWPSEIQQDELDGWALRAYPLRVPVETRGVWEKYETEIDSRGAASTDTSTSTQQQRAWFYNKQTEANSYEQPPEWDPQASVSGPRAGLQRLENDTRSSIHGWATYTDEASGYAYYYNHHTGESTYTRPLELLTPRYGATSGDTSVERSADGWAKYVDASAWSAVYYYNHHTGESTYTRPTSFLTPRRGQAPVETGASIVDGWAKYYDDATCVYYYYNARTRTSTFDRPVEFTTPRVDGTAVNGVVFEDEASQRTYEYDTQTTECRVVSTSTSTTARAPLVGQGYR